MSLTPSIFKTWFRANMALYLKPIWLEIKGAMASAKAYADGLIATDADWSAGTATGKAPSVKQVKDALASVSVTGVFRGGFDSLAELPGGAKNGDWAVLRKDDGASESGVYVKGSAGWSYVMDITTLNEVAALMATDAEFAAGTATDKLVNVKQVAGALAAVAGKGGRFLGAGVSQIFESAILNGELQAVAGDFIFDTNGDAIVLRRWDGKGAFFDEGDRAAKAYGSTEQAFFVAAAFDAQHAVQLGQLVAVDLDSGAVSIPAVTAAEAAADWAAAVAA